ncbi:MAG TPA: trypsin-like peptidase domain-containing protein [Candidatus Krumholzibacteria bacterium]|nr:trypsin-like peptidase domain-containing protein [Candidatus Krumholzibacteria bacterium]
MARPHLSILRCAPAWSATGRVLFGIALVAMVGLGGPASGQEFSDDQDLNPGMSSPFARVAQRVMPAVVSITASKSFEHPPVEGEDLFRFFPRERGMRRDMQMPGAGSGFVISADGYILTNNHVIADATEIEVQFPGDDASHPAEIVGQDPSTDLALLKIDTQGERLDYLVFTDSEGVRVGDYAIAIGNPLGELAGSLTVGVISAKGRSDLQIQGGTPRYQDFLQTDAAINFGNSGGPLVDIHGRVIGVNTAINASGQNIGFTIPSNLAVSITEQLRTTGRVVRGYLGVRMDDMTRDLAEGRDLDIDYGVIIREVMDDSPAERGGVEIGDVVYEFNGDRVRNGTDLQWKVADSPVGERAELRVHRDGSDLTVEVVLDELDLAQTTMAVMPEGDIRGIDDETWLGITVTSLDDTEDPRVGELIDMYDIRDTKGVLILDVEEGSPAEMARLQPGDVIFEVVDRPVDSIDDFRDAQRRYVDRTRKIAIGYRRGGDVTGYATVDPLQEDGTNP